MPQAKAVLEQHQELAEITEIAFSALTLIFASILFVPRLLKREPTRVISTVLPLVFLMFYATGAISLANTAKALGIHISTLRYRVERIESTLGVSLEDPRIRFQLQFAIELYRLREE